MAPAAANLYIHFPFCRRKCSYCALHSRAGTSAAARAQYVAGLVTAAAGHYRTAYFGGGTPALCDLRPLLQVVSAEEFTVELHPLDVSDDLLQTLHDGGVNRISMGVEALDDATLSAMGRGYTFAEAARAFAQVRRYFENAGIDLIVGYPGMGAAVSPQLAELADWGLKHCSVYSLIRERGTRLDRAVQEWHLALPDDDTVMDRIIAVSEFLAKIGLRRYEISNYAVPGWECRHNLAVWRGEDYLGLGEGAHGRLGRLRTPSGELVSADEDLRERTLFRLRTVEGLDTARFPEWRETLDRQVDYGLLTRRGDIYFLTPRGTEVCDAILNLV